MLQFLWGPIIQSVLVHCIVFKLLYGVPATVPPTCCSSTVLPQGHLVGQSGHTHNLKQLTLVSENLQDWLFGLKTVSEKEDGILIKAKQQGKLPLIICSHIFQDLRALQIFQLVSTVQLKV